MHPLFNVQEVIRNVFEFVFVFDDFPIGSQNLAALASTCWTFQEPALDILWRSVPNLQWLITRCLPSDAWEVKPGDKIGKYECKILSLRRPTTPSDWVRCKFYAHRIRHFGYPMENPHNTLPDWLFTLDVAILQVLALNQMLCLSNIQHLCWGSQNPETALPYIHLFLGQSLVDLDIRIPKNDPNFVLATLFYSATTTFPQLKTLSFSSTSPGIELDASTNLALVHMIEKLDYLESFSSDFGLSDNLVCALAASKITSLKVWWHTIEEILPLLTGEFPAFPSLRNFSVHAQNLQKCSDFIEIINARRLSSVAIRVYNYLTPSIPPLAAEIHNFFRALEKHSSPSSLTQVRIWHRGDNEVFEGDDYRITFDTFKPLLKSRNLEALYLMVMCPFDLNDAEMTIIGTNWTFMRDLNLGYNWMATST